MDTDATKKGHGIFSLKFRILGIIILSVLLATVINLVIILPMMRSNMLEVTKNYIFDMASSYGRTLQLLYDNIQDEMYNGTAGAIIQDANIKGVPSSYAYLVDKNGIVRYHPNEAEIGHQTNNDIVMELVRDMMSGVKPEAEIVRYNLNGKQRYAGYYISDRMNFVLVFAADEDDILEPMNDMVTRSIIGAVCTLGACGVMGLFVALLVVRPIAMITRIITKLGDLDFSFDEAQKELNKRKDETGRMSRAVMKLTEKLAGVIGNLQKQSLALMDAANALDRNSQETIRSVGQVEQAVGDIASGATSQADETQTATENVVAIGEMINTTSDEVASLNSKSKDIAEASESATKILGELDDINRKAVDAVRVIYEQTNTTNESAQKIREATTLISSIAEETNLLSLNASIEAARAGEQGRGFAVVAAQIQKLAEQSNQSANQIEQIIASLLSDTANAVRTMDEVQDIMGRQNEKVLSASSIVTKVKEEIDNTLQGVGTIAQATVEMQQARGNVVDVVQNLTAIAEENAASTEQTSASVTEIAAIIEDIATNASSLKGIAEQLDINMRRFKL